MECVLCAGRCARTAFQARPRVSSVFSRKQWAGPTLPSQHEVWLVPGVTVVPFGDVVMGSNWPRSVGHLGSRGHVQTVCLQFSAADIKLGS